MTESLKNRTRYLADQRKAGRYLMGVFPAQYPREILWALDILPVEIWDPPLTPDKANTHLQAFICSIVRQGLEQVLTDTSPPYQGFLFPHTCDSLQNLGSLVGHLLKPEIPCFFFYHPKAPYRDASRTFYRHQLEALITQLEQHLGKMEPEKLQQAVAISRRIAGRIDRIYTRRVQGRLNATNREFYTWIRQGEYLLPADYLQSLEGFSRAGTAATPTGPSIIVSGILPGPGEILDLLDALEVRIVNDDLLNCGRRLRRGPGPAPDDLEALTEGYFAMPPCSTRTSPLEERLAYLLQMLETSTARGILFLNVKFCEPELFDRPLILEALKARAIPALWLDTEVNQGLSGQAVTRLEAFVEMLG